MSEAFDVIVVGGGHAGCEAACAAARLGMTSDSARCHRRRSPHAMQSGGQGTAKSHLVREIDALGGLMGRAIDATGIQFKLLNRSRGPRGVVAACAGRQARLLSGCSARSTRNRTSAG